MCGIGTITLGKTAATGLPLDKAVDAMLKDLDHRGGDATGLLTISAGGRIDVQKAVCDAAEFEAYRSPIALGTRAIAMHTRLATQGPQSFNRNNHPVISGQAYVVHNGIVWDNHLKRRPGQPEVDTFALALAADCEAKRRQSEHPQAHAERIARTLAQEDGSAAVGVAFRSQAFLVTARLAYSPLYVAEAEGVRICASSEWAVSEGFAALGIPLNGREVQRTNGKKGRKLKTWVEWEEDIVCASEGDVFAWDAGMHSAGRVAMPKRALRAYSAAGGWSDEGYGAHDLDSIAARVADAHSGVRDSEVEWGRCETCDTYHWTENMRQRWGMLVCQACETAFVASGATEEDEVQA